MDDGRPIFIQLAEQIENDILDGNLQEESQVPSTNEYASFHRINPATAGKGVNLLVASGILYKRRGIGMFVAEGARERITQARRTRFTEDYIEPLLREATKLGITPQQLTTMIATATDIGPRP